MSKKIGVLLMSVAYVSMACGLLAGCGTKGPLYIPEQRYPQASTTKPDNAPKATDSTQPSTK
jgi:predicted small lipoprotein YifL